LPIPASAGLPTNRFETHQVFQAWKQLAAAGENKKFSQKNIMHAKKNVVKDQRYNNITQYGFLNDPIR
jgi:hypothetical protein